MILNSADFNRVTFQILKNPSLIGPQAGLNSLGKPRASFLGGEDDMDAQYMQRLRHSEPTMTKFGMPFQGERESGFLDRGRCLAMPPPTMDQAFGLKRGGFLDDRSGDPGQKKPFRLIQWQCRAALPIWDGQNEAKITLGHAVGERIHISCHKPPILQFGMK